VVKGGCEEGILRSASAGSQFCDRDKKAVTKSSSRECLQDVTLFSPQLDEKCRVTSGMRTLILCVGNASSSDDGIGARIGQVLQSLPLPGDIQVEVVSRFRIELPDRLAEVDHLVVVDGLTAEAEPGTCTVVDVTGHPAAVVASGCCHAREVADIIQLAREVAPEGEGCAITIGGVRVEHSDWTGGDFSSAVLSAVPRIVDLLLLTTGAGLKLRLLAAELLRKSERPTREPVELYSWGEASAQAAGLQ